MKDESCDTCRFLHPTESYPFDGVCTVEDIEGMVQYVMRDYLCDRYESTSPEDDGQ